MDDKKQGKQKRRSVSAARLYWAIIGACERYDLSGDATAGVGGYGFAVQDLLDALKDDNMEAAR